ncbi:putative Zn-dependent peptidase [Pedobacter sp. AK017]|uniref:hypothetical protein n=1 Tax=Pedobacter sp. AK017 TaxID=2723073 RepID=UPI00160DF410|nr:hypothetical protein [Pedobacter sp. AK017]MBB5438383.1 putative Zn-dependent peptidase [Pedobacter sp. AK017]
MKILKTTTTAIALLIGTSSGFAQSDVMKDPVSYTLKNGMTIIIAENQATPKVYANLSFEAAKVYVAEKAAVQEVTTTLLNQQLTALDAGLSYSDKGLNLATTSAGLEAVLQTMYAYINAPGFTEAALAKAKAELLAHLTAQDRYFPETVNAASLNKLSLADVNAYYNEINKPALTFLTIVGNINPAAAKNYTKTVMNQVKPAADFSKNYLVSIN